MVVKKEKKEAKKTKKQAKPQKVVKAKAVKPAALAEKVKVPTEEKPAETEETGAGNGRYWEAMGRRKTASARVRLYTRGEKGIWVNDKPFAEYFQYDGLLNVVEDPIKKMKSGDRFRVSAKISGGGIHAQAEALRHGISRALVKFNPDFRKRLKRAGFLTRDPRMKERKKFGLKGARRAPQWAKR
jgi:small subunit ribosomal protein S9